MSDFINNVSVDSIGQRNSYVKTWGCGGLELWKNGTGFSEIANILGSKPGTIFTMLRDTEPPRKSWRLNSLRKR
ncbi:hypothetical protein AW096_28190 [Escherichia coli]|nr:hypothetical protein AW096_28190 [Escherichia coli]